MFFIQQTGKLLKLKEKRNNGHTMSFLCMLSHIKLEEKGKVDDQDTQSENWSKTGQYFHVGNNYLPLE